MSNDAHRAAVIRSVPVMTCRRRQARSSVAWLLASVMIATPGSPLSAQRGAPPPPPPASSVLRVGASVLDIGTELEGPAVFELIQGAVFDRAGNIYVLDAGSHQVRVFDARGTHVMSVGQQGRGPGDFSSPQNIVHDGDSLLYVVDPVNGINIFSTVNGRLTYRRRIMNEQLPQAMCLSRGGPIVLTRLGGRLLHRIRPDGTVTESFGTEFMADSADMLQAHIMRTSGSLLRCDAATGAIYLTHGYLNEIWKYDDSGRLLWKAALPEYLGPQYSHNPAERSVSIGFGRYSTRGLTVFGNRVVVQAHDTKTEIRRVPGGGVTRKVEHLGVMTYVLDAGSDVLMAKGDWQPTIVDARGADLLAFEEDPFPRIRVFRMAR